MIIQNNQFPNEKVQENYPEAFCFKPMKINSFPGTRGLTIDDVINDDNYFATEKIDGSFYAFNKTPNYSYLFGRTTSVKTGLPTEKGANVPHILAAFDKIPENTVIIGEIYTGDKTKQVNSVTTIMGCLPTKAIKKQEEEGYLHFYIYDIIMLNGEDLSQKGALERYNILAKLCEEYNITDNEFIELAALLSGDNRENFENIVAQGGEGIVLKRKDSIYDFGKRPAWQSIKLKKSNTIDAVLIGFEDATIEYTGKELESWPYWRLEIDDNHYTVVDECMYGEEGWYPITKGHFYNWKTAIQVGAYDENDNLKLIGTIASGLTDDLREDFANHPQNYLNRVVEIDCMELMKKDSTLRHGVFKKFRYDKNKEECTIKEIFS